MSQIIRFNTLAICCPNVEQGLALNTIYKQCVRWKRKPIWLPTAKSKLFRVPKRPEIPLEEQTEILRLYNNYRTTMKSIRSHFVQEAQRKEVQMDLNHQLRLAEEDFLRCSEINDLWNAEIAVKREKRLELKKERQMEAAMVRVEVKKARDASLQARADRNIRRMKKQSANFITADNIDEAIEKTLANVINHNVAVDLNGQIIQDTESVQRYDLPVFNEEHFRYEAQKKGKAKN